MHTNVFGLPIKYAAWSHQDDLPLYIAGSYDFYTAYIGDKRCILLIPTEALATLPSLKKQIAKIHLLWLQMRNFLRMSITMTTAKL